ncbi:MAG: SpoIIE family protein phosphatase [Actinomycetota bacterium]|nr:SpoIIE family protein phosphatase [Actinomycetota bacterium]
MGKGVGATKEAVSVTHALRLLTLDGCPMEDLVARADTLTTAQSPDLVATVMVVRYRPADGHVRLAGGGHPPALVISADETVRLVSAPGIPIGYPGAGTTEIVSLTLDRGDTLVLYTDGLIEATKDIVVGLERITAAAAETAKYPAPHLARALVERSLSGAMRRDDSLALVLRRRIPPGTDRAAPLGAFEYRFSPSVVAVPLTRHLFADWLEHLTLDESEVGDLLLVASELCSNAVRHASGQPGALALRAWADADALVIEVEDDGPGMELSRRIEDPDLDAEQGRGLYVVRALIDDLSVRRDGERTVVRAVRRAVLPG